ncbi:UNVERIFIED_CONTAM: putative mitochondrial protein [Sesamum latifolium]|uniref:Mitochondrial protein n=1 Tax=Sesamum latifolium TaxID=2727402 RepID=A0AAW2WD58_9LAMI
MWWSFSTLRDFRLALDNAGLFDLGYSGDLFTWCNRREAPHTILERLDRACGNNNWRLSFPNTQVSPLESIYSDHTPLLIELAPVRTRRERYIKSFRFETAWTRTVDCERSWLTPLGTSVQNLFQQKLDSCRSKLLATKKMGCGVVGKKIAALEKRITQLHRRNITAASKNEENRLGRSLKICFRQRKLFGSSVLNLIGLRKVIEILGFFILKLIGHSKEISSRDSRIRPTELLKPNTAEEITFAISHMAPLKSPGPDGMPPIFFHKYWHIVKHDVFNCALIILNDRILDPELNFTHISLIPKRNNPELITHFRPISLCNVIMRIVTKCIANRLKPLLEKIISPTQSAFIPGRLITDNVLIAFEINHFLKNKTWGKKGHMALKLDISKGYDKVEWSFLRQVLLKLGFHEHFIQLVLLCVSSVSYSFMLSGRQFGKIIPERGLRQGDSLSPYLFLLCTEALSSLITRVETSGQLDGIRICHSAPSISHLFFVDDALLCCQASLEAMDCIQSILQVYSKALGQEINMQKSVVVFSKNTPGRLMSTISNGLGIRVADRHEKYLGLPSVVGRSKNAVFNSIRDRIWKKISS